MTVLHPTFYCSWENGDIFESRPVVLNPDIGGASLREGGRVGHGGTPGILALGGGGRKSASSRPVM